MSNLVDCLLTLYLLNILLCFLSSLEGKLRIDGAHPEYRILLHFLRKRNRTRYSIFFVENIRDTTGNGVVCFNICSKP